MEATPSIKLARTRCAVEGFNADQSGGVSSISIGDRGCAKH